MSPPTPSRAVFFHISVQNYWQFPSSPAPQGETGTYWNDPRKAEIEKKKKKLFLSLASSPASHYFSPSSGKQTALQTKQQHMLDLTQLNF